MPSRLDDAANAYRHAQATLADARGRVNQARADIEQARVELAEAIVDAARAGMRQVEIVRRSGYTRESVRRICRAAGIDADE
jgi:multidrug resistance efflux pump